MIIGECAHSYLLAMPRARKGVVQIRFEILEYLYYNPSPQPKTRAQHRLSSPLT
jgi:hypothetical protein